MLQSSLSNYYYSNKHFGTANIFLKPGKEIQKKEGTNNSLQTNVIITCKYIHSI
jgi:hypothetical protein